MPSSPWELLKAGLFFGMGLIVAYGVLQLIILILGIILSGAGHSVKLP